MPRRQDSLASAPGSTDQVQPGVTRRTRAWPGVVGRLALLGANVLAAGFGLVILARDRSSAELLMSSYKKFLAQFYLHSTRIGNGAWSEA